ncbi:ribonuclease T [Methylohalomonas lacus]|uniref:Ribonuclease T n=1 Tax=Methylohalomonas lacus TaxID=398773 RepID=A0AAE3HKT9_9GAMM|nr:ribonuclease T [Methylohalomonas lacus]MCS3902278.1 ribonuclease T [Methylohalomonas lacus]
METEDSLTQENNLTPADNRFRGYLPVVVDVETGGFNSNTDALLEIAAVVVSMNGDRQWRPTRTIAYHVKPFTGANIEQAAIDFNGIDPYHPLRPAIPEKDALGRIFTAVRTAMKENNCKRAILVGHNAAFDLNFLNAAVERCGIKRSPFHPFSTFDTVSLAGLVYGQTVLARAIEAAGIEWESDRAHSAAYDAEKTAELFCAIVNQWDHKA